MKELYCSAKCQKIAWKAHKLSCGVASDDRPGVNVYPERIDGETAKSYYSGISMQGYNRQNMKPRTLGEQSSLPQKDGIVVVKLQICITGPGPMLLYNRDRSFRVPLDKNLLENHLEDRRKLESLCRTKGQMNGAKIYLDSQVVTQSGGKKCLRIYTDAVRDCSW